MTQRTSGRNQLHCNNGSPPKRYDDSSPSKWREKKFEIELLKFAEKPSHEPLGAPRTQSQLLRIINAPAVSTEDPEDAPWRKGETFSQPSSITKATIIYPFPTFSREGKVRHRNKTARPRGRDALRQYVYGEWLAEYRLLLLEKRNIQQKRQRRPEFAALEK